jgi:alcohol dehydrogenase class IV
MTVAWSFPTRILFGDGAVDETGTEATKLGAKHALIVTDRGVVRAGLTEGVTESLKKAGIAWSTYDDTASNPEEASVDAAVDAFRGAKADLVIGVGGGAPLDVAKLVRLRATHTLPLAEYDDAIDGWQKVTNDVPPMIAIPTTAGTGSEVGRSGVVSLVTHGHKRKVVIFAPRLMPNVAILDPRLTVGLPAKLTAATGFDALTHCIEAYCALGDHPMADAIALEGISLCAHYLERAVQEPNDIDARGAMQKSAMMGAVAFQKGLGACHSLAHPLGSELDVHHGLANALCLPAVIDYNRHTIEKKIAHVARILGTRGDDIETLAFECSGAVQALRKKCGLPASLEAVGVKEEQLPALAQLAFEDACHRSNPRPCSKDDLLALYKASM